MKIKIVATDYIDIDLENYENANTPEEALNAEKEQYENNEVMLEELFSEKPAVKFSLVEDEDTYNE